MGYTQTLTNRPTHRHARVVPAVVALLVATAALAGAAGSVAADHGDADFPVDADAQGGIASDGESLYALTDADGDGSQEVARIDPETDAVREAYEMPFDYGTGLTYHDGSVYVVSFGESEVAEIDVGDGTVENRFGVTGAPVGIAHLEGSLYVADVGYDEVYEYGTAGQPKGSAFALDDGTGDVGSLGSDGTFLFVGDTADSPAIYNYSADGTFNGKVTDTDTENDAVASTRFGLLNTDADGSITVAVDTVAPRATATGPDAEQLERSVVRLDASASHDPYSDGNVSYEWTQVNGSDATIRSPGSAATNVTLPDVDGNRTVTFEVTVTDEAGNAATTTVDVRTVDVGQTGEWSDDGTVFTAGQTNRVEVTVETNVDAEVRDVIPAAWTVDESFGDVDRVERDGDVKYVYFDGDVSAADNGTTYAYFAEAPDSTGQYTFRNTQVRPTGFGDAAWRDVSGTSDDNAVVGQSTEADA